MCTFLSFRYLLYNPLVRGFSLVTSANLKVDRTEIRELFDQVGVRTRGRDTDLGNMREF